MVGETRDRMPAPEPTSAHDDATLVALAQRDIAAFAPLYERYAPAVYRYCRRVLGSREAAEDATSTIFANVMAALPGYRADEGSFRSWLFVIAHNVVVNAQRATRPVSPLDVAASVIDGGPTPEELALAADRRRALRDVLSRLSDDQRRVVELRMAGLTGEEIARVLGRGHPAVRQLQRRAVARLRVLLGVEEGGRHD